MTLVSEEIQDEVKILANDPIIQQMAEEIPDAMDLESSTFMYAASDEYNARGGENALTIGGPAKAIRYLKERNE